MNTSESHDIVVVGPGLAGLTAATLCARSGARVLLVGPATGGRARSKRHDGFILNQGAHALYRKGRASRVLRRLGVPIVGGVPRKGLRLELDGRTTPLPTGAVSLLGNGALSWAARRELARILVRPPTPSAGESAAQWIERAEQTDTRRVLRAVARLTTYNADPKRLAAAIFLRQLKTSAGGVVYLDGGWQSLVDGLVRAADAAGVERQPESARAIEGTEGGFRVHVGDRIHEARASIVAVPPAVVARLRRSQAPLASLEPVRAACLDLGLSALPDPAKQLVLQADGFGYLSVHSASAALAPAGRHLIQLLRYLDDCPCDAEAELEALMDRHQPGWRAHVVTRRFLPRPVVTYAAPGPERVDLELEPGLFAAGDWVQGDAVLADAALDSAERAAKAALAIATRRAA